VPAVGSRPIAGALSLPAGAHPTAKSEPLTEVDDVAITAEEVEKAAHGLWVTAARHASARAVAAGGAGSLVVGENERRYICDLNCGNALLFPVVSDRTPLSIRRE
jgi:hypothetical protein